MYNIRSLDKKRVDYFMLSFRRRTPVARSGVELFAEKITNTLAALQAMTTINNQRVKELKKQLSDAVADLYNLFSRLEKQHCVVATFALTNYIIAKMDEMISNGSFQDRKIIFDGLKELWTNLKEEVLHNVEYFKQTISLFPRKMKKQEWIDLIKLYDACCGNQEDILFRILKNYMETKEFKECSEAELLRSNGYVGSMTLQTLKNWENYYACNSDAVENDQSFFYKLLFSPSLVEMQQHALNEEGKNVVHRLPLELHHYLFDFLAPADLARLGGSCAFFHRETSSFVLRKKRNYHFKLLQYDVIDLSGIIKHKLMNNDFILLNQDTVAILGEAIYIFEIHVHLAGHQLAQHRLEHIKTLAISARKIIALSDNQLLTIEETMGIKIWHWTTGDVIAAVNDSYVEHVARTKEGNFVVMANKGCAIYSPDLKRMDGGFYTTGFVQELLVNENNKVILLSSSDMDGIKTTLYSSDMDGKSMMTNEDGIHSACLLSKNRIAVISSNFSIAIFDANTLTHKEAKHCVTLSKPDRHKCMRRFNGIFALEDDKMIGYEILSGEIVFTLFDDTLNIMNQWHLPGYYYSPPLVSLSSGNIMILNMDKQQVHAFGFPALMKTLEQAPEEQRVAKSNGV